MIKAKRVAMRLDCVGENLNLELTHEDLRVREQFLNMKKLKNLSASVNQDEVLALLDKAPDNEPLVEDKLP